MTRDLLNAICESLPGAEQSDPWGDGNTAWKIGGKIFATVGALNEGVSVKTASVEDAALLIDLGIGEKAPYFHRSWVRLPWGVEDDELRHRVLESYRIIRSGLTKKLQSTLPALAIDEHLKK